MRPSPGILLTLAAAALLGAAGGASAQYYGRGGGQDYHAARPMPGRDGGGRHHGGWQRNRRHGPGLVVTAPDDDFYDDEDDATRRAQRARRAPRRASSGAPPAGERRLLPDEVVIEVRNSLSDAQIDALQRRHRLTRVERQRFALTGTTLFRWHIPDGRSVASVIRALERDNAVLSAQPNYQYALQQAAGSAGEAAQYELAKLNLPQAQQIAKGDGVRVAVIDSMIDAENAELVGSVVDSFDTLKGPDKPNKHGTGVASLIAGHGKLNGAAPDARILAVRAFDPAGGSAQGTSFNVLKGLDWAVAHKAQIVNMSFAGPRDPALHRALAAARKRGLVLVAAAGNGGAKSPPLYPAADDNVIAVTATDAHDRLLGEANRGRYIDLAAPGVQVLVAVPGGYDVSSGTSYAAAEVSGIAALMLQRDPALGPARLQRILMRTARDLGRKGRDAEFGAGLADAFAAVSAEGPVTASAPLPPRRETAGSR
jgi:subtilisin family serine protease